METERPGFPARGHEPERRRWASAEELRAMSDEEMQAEVRRLGWPDTSRLSFEHVEECARRGWLVKRGAPARRDTTDRDWLG